MRLVIDTNVLLSALCRPFPIRTPQPRQSYAEGP